MVLMSVKGWLANNLVAEGTVKPVWLASSAIAYPRGSAVAQETAKYRFHSFVLRTMPSFIRRREGALNSNNELKCLLR
jgi:hypothetical protein